MSTIYVHNHHDLLKLQAIYLCLFFLSFFPRSGMHGNNMYVHNIWTSFSFPLQRNISMATKLFYGTLATTQAQDVSIYHHINVWCFYVQSWSCLNFSSIFRGNSLLGMKEVDVIIIQEGINSSQCFRRMFVSSSLLNFIIASRYISGLIQFSERIFLNVNRIIWYSPIKHTLFSVIIIVIILPYILT